MKRIDFPLMRPVNCSRWPVLSEPLRPVHRVLCAEPLVFRAFGRAVKVNPVAQPLFHSDRGFQYTSRAFHQKLIQAGMVQSMSRVAHCIDSGPMESFWGILKWERYYRRCFTSK